MKKDKYIFPAVLDYAYDGITIMFPDLPGCLTCADTVEKAVISAKEACGLHLYSMEEDGETAPEPSKVDKIKLESNQAVVFIDVWMPLIREAVENQSVKKTLTIPKWLNDAASEYSINFSQVLQAALKEKLGIINKR